MNKEHKKQLFNLTKKFKILCTNILIVKYSRHPKSFNLNDFKRACSRQLYDLLMTNTAQHYCLISKHAFKYLSDLVRLDKGSLNDIYQKAYSHYTSLVTICTNNHILDFITRNDNQSYIQLYNNLKYYDGTIRGAFHNLMGVESTVSLHRNLYYLYIDLEKILVSPISRQLMKQPDNLLKVAPFPKIKEMVRIDNQKDKTNFNLSFIQIERIRRNYIHCLLHYIKFSLIDVLCSTLKANLETLAHFAIIKHNQLKDELTTSNNYTLKWAKQDVKHEQKGYVKYLVKKLQYLFGDYQDYHFLFVFKLLPDLSSMLNKPYDCNSLTSLIHVLMNYAYACKEIRYKFLQHQHSINNSNDICNINSTKINSKHTVPNTSKELKLAEELVCVLKKQNKLTYKKYGILKKLNKLNFKSSK